MTTEKIRRLFKDFQAGFNEAESDALWKKKSEKFRGFWKTRVMSGRQPLNDAEIDEIVLILDKNGKGSSSETQAIAKMMIPQNKWRKMFRDFKSNSEYPPLLTQYLMPGILQKGQSLSMIYMILIRMRKII